MKPGQVVAWDIHSTLRTQSAESQAERGHAVPEILLLGCLGSLQLAAVELSSDLLLVLPFLEALADEFRGVRIIGIKLFAIQIKIGIRQELRLGGIDRAWPPQSAANLCGVRNNQLRRARWQSVL